MGKARTRNLKEVPPTSSKENSFQWYPHASFSALAWAQYCLEWNLDFEDTVTWVLKEKWPDETFRIDQIWTRVRKLWGRLGKNHYIDKDGSTRNSQRKFSREEIIKDGAQCLDFEFFKALEKQAFDDALSEFRNEEWFKKALPVVSQACSISSLASY
jgi:hypothetical protein